MKNSILLISVLFLFLDCSGKKSFATMDEMRSFIYNTNNKYSFSKDYSNHTIKITYLPHSFIKQLFGSAISNADKYIYFGMDVYIKTQESHFFNNDKNILNFQEFVFSELPKSLFVSTKNDTLYPFKIQYIPNLVKIVQPEQFMIVFDANILESSKSAIELNLSKLEFEFNRKDFVFETNLILNEPYLKTISI